MPRRVAAFFSVLVLTLAAHAVAAGDPAAVPVGNQPQPYAAAGTNEPRLRGFTVDQMSAATLLKAAAWHANSVRYMMRPMYRADQIEHVSYAAAWQHMVDALPGELAQADAAGLAVVLCLFEPPNEKARTYPAGKERLAAFWDDDANSNALVRCWEQLAGLCRERHQPIWFEILNEPLDWRDFPNTPKKWPVWAQTTIDAIRRIDTHHPIVVEAGPGGLCWAYTNFPALKGAGLIYSTHQYQPHAYTHQGIADIHATDLQHAYLDRQLTWPGAFSDSGGGWWDKARLRQELQPLIDFQKRNGVRVYISEFSAIKWAPNAAGYLRDSLELYESLGWDWSYHALDEWPGWSLEHTDAFDGSAPAQRSQTPTARAKVMREFLDRNTHAAGSAGVVAPQTVRTDGHAVAAAKPGDVVFRLDLSQPQVRAALEAQGAEVVKEGPTGGLCLRIANVAGDAAGKIVAIPFDSALLRGCRVCFLASVRGQDVHGADPKAVLKSWEGVKFQPSYESAALGRKWTDASKLQGTFAWREVGLIVGMADDAANGKLNVGLGKAVGTAWLSDVRIILVNPKVTRPAVRPDSAALQTVTTRRGVMSPSQFKAEDFDVMAAWKVNTVRWHMQGVNWKPQTYEQWLQEHLDDLARALDAAQTRGIKMAVNIMDTPGGRQSDGSQELFMNKAYQDQFVANWERIARRFKDYPALWAYDLINEPVQNHPSPPGVENWLGIQVRAAQAIRAIDPQTPIIIETDQWDSPDAFTWLKPISVSNIIYQAHMYWPGAFTHQGVFTDQGVAKDMNMAHAVTYPGVIDGQLVDKEALRRFLSPVRDFQKAYGVPIYIGEFSAARWAPGAAQYLDDCIAIFEEYGWDWTYHAFREWPGWSVEHADLPYDRTNHPVATQPTARMLVLKKWLSRNAAGATSKAPAAAQQDTAHPVN